MILATKFRVRDDSGSAARQKSMQKPLCGWVGVVTPVYQGLRFPARTVATTSPSRHDNAIINTPSAADYPTDGKGSLMDYSPLLIREILKALMLSYLAN